MSYSVYRVTKAKIRPSNKKIQKNILEPETLEQAYEPWYILIVLPFILFLAVIFHSIRYKRVSAFHASDNIIRKQILSILERYGFEQFNILQKRLQTGVSILYWHLSVLEEYQYIKTSKINRFKIIYLAGYPLNEVEVILYCSVRTSKGLAVLQAFLEKNTWTVQELIISLTEDKKIVKYYLNSLANLELITKDTFSNNLYLNQDKKYICQNIINRHHESNVL